MLMKPCVNQHESRKMAHRKQSIGDSISVEFIQEICVLYGDHYDDRVEDSKPPTAGRKDGKAEKRQAGENWRPGLSAEHKSLSGFQKELLEKYGISLSTSKIRKILVSGGLWSTERSREVQELYMKLTQADSEICPEQAVSLISKKLGVSKPTVVINLPYINGVNRLETKSKNAVRCERYRSKGKEKGKSETNHSGGIKP